MPVADSVDMFDELTAAAKRAEEEKQLLDRQQARFEAQAAQPAPQLAHPTVPAAARPDKPSQGYWSSVLWSFLFPSASMSNLATLMVLWFVFVIAPFSGFLCIFGLIIQLAIVAWYAAFRCNVVASAAGGDEELPNLSYTGDVVGELIYPAFQWVGSWAVMCFPAVIYLLIAVGTGSISTADVAPILLGGLGGLMAIPDAAIPFIVLLYVGLFLWPMVILCITLGGFQTLYRIDLILVTIVKSFPAYLVTVALVAGTVVLDQVVHTWVVSAGFAGAVSGGGASGFGSLLGTGITVMILTTGVTIYFDIVAVRVIGLYYHHFKRRFAWSWG